MQQPPTPRRSHRHSPAPASSTPTSSTAVVNTDSAEWGRLFTRLSAINSARGAADTAELSGMAVEDLPELLRSKEEELAISAEIGQLLLSKYDALMREHDALRDKNSQLMSDMDALNARHADTLAISSQLDQDRRATAKTVADLNAKIEVLEQALDDKRELAGREQPPDTPSRSWLRERARLLDQVHLLHDEMATLRKQHGESLASERRVRDELQQKCAQLSTELAEKSQPEPSSSSHSQMAAEIAKQRDIIRRMENERQAAAAENEANADLADLVKEAAVANERLRTQLEEQSELLLEARQELAELRTEFAVNDVSAPATPMGHAPPLVDPRKSIFGELESMIMSRVVSPIATDMSAWNQDGDQSEYLGEQPSPLKNKQQRKRSPRVDMEAAVLPQPNRPGRIDQGTVADGNVETARSLLDQLQHSPLFSSEDGSQTATSPSSSGSGSLACLRAWKTLTSQFQCRLAATDTAALNRRLRRGFDMQELTRLSNSIIDNVLADLKTMKARLSCDKTDDNATQMADTLVAVTTSLLTDNGNMRKTLNELGLAYVTKLGQMGQDDYARHRSTVDTNDSNSSVQPIPSARTSRPPSATSSSSASWSDRLKRSISSRSQLSKRSSMVDQSQLRASQSTGQLSRFLPRRPRSTSLERIPAGSSDNEGDSTGQPTTSKFDSMQLFGAPIRRHNNSNINSSRGRMSPAVVATGRSTTPSVAMSLSQHQPQFTVASTVSRGLTDAIGDSENSAGNDEFSGGRPVSVRQVDQGQYEHCSMM